MIPIAYNIRSLKERRRTTIASALGIAMVVFVLSSSMMLSDGIDAAMGMAGRDDVAVVLRKGTDSELGSSLTQEQLSRIPASPGVKAAYGELVVVATIARAGGGGQISNVQLRGLSQLWRDVRIIAGPAPRPGTKEAV